MVNTISTAMLMAGLHRCCQVKTNKTRRVLSFHYLGLRGYEDRGPILLWKQYEATVLNFRTMISDNLHN
jgi:hypothetical protein